MHIFGNTGIRPVIITNIYLNSGRKNLVINNLMVDFQSDDLRAKFPKELSPESIVEVYIPYSKLSDSFIDLLNRKEIAPNQKIKILATDTTSGKYYCLQRLTAKRIAKVN